MDTKKLLVLAAALAFSAGASAQLYKWKDANGRTRYGDTPPPGVDASRLRVPSSAPSPAPSPDASDAKADKAEKLTPEQAFRKRQQDRAAAEEKAAKERADADAKRTNCEAAQTQLRILESGQRVSTVNAAGEKVYLDDDQRAAQMARAQKAVSDWCR
jgi:hypothetical protein